MANSNVVYGLRPVQTIKGNPYNGKTGRYYVPASDGTAIFIGDLVKYAGSADANGVPSVTKAASTNNVIGVVVAVESVTRDSTIYRAASTERYLLVADDADLLFAIQEDSVGGALAAADVGLNANWIDGGGSTVTGLSGIQLDSSTKAVTATLDFAIHRLERRVDNAIGQYADWLVRLNNHQYVDGTTGVS